MIQTQAGHLWNNNQFFTSSESTCRIVLCSDRCQIMPLPEESQLWWWWWGWGGWGGWWWWRTLKTSMVTQHHYWQFGSLAVWQFGSLVTDMGNMREWRSRCPSPISQLGSPNPGKWVVVEYQSKVINQIKSLLKKVVEYFPKNFFQRLSVTWGFPEVRWITTSSSSSSSDSLLSMSYVDPLNKSKSSPCQFIDIDILISTCWVFQAFPRSIFFTCILQH